MKKSIAVLIATYNGERYLTKQLESLRLQTSSDFICYIHDDGSNDNTLSIISEYITQYPNIFIELKYPSTGSAKANFMSMLKHIDAEYVMFCDQDDIWFPKKIEKTLIAMHEVEETQIISKPIVVFSDMEVVDQDLNVISNTFYYGRYDYSRTNFNELFVENIAPGCTMMINRKLLNLALMLKDNDHIFMHDGWFMIIASIFGEIRFINEPMMLYRQHSKNLIGAENKSHILFLYKKIRRVFFGKQIDESKKAIWYHYRMAEEILQLPDLPVKTKLLMEKFCKLKTKNKISRVIFYIKYRFLKKRRNWWMLLWV